MPAATCPHTYVIAMGSNVRGLHGPPERAIEAALAAIGGVIAASPILRSAPLGPSRRRYANAVALVASEESPSVLLDRLKRLEHAFGRRRGRQWGARTLDLDIVLWSGGAWSGPGLVIPHVAFRTRAFVLRPLANVAPAWRDPLGGRTVRQLLHLVDRPRPHS